MLICAAANSSSAMAELTKTMSNSPPSRGGVVSGPAHGSACGGAVVVADDDRPNWPGVHRALLMRLRACSKRVATSRRVTTLRMSFT